MSGYAYASYFRTRPAYWWSVEDSIYIAPQAKGKGMGKALLQRLISDCTALGFRQFIAVIGDGHDASASVRLHARCGFRHCGTIEGSGFKHGRWLDTVLMQLDMNGGTATLPGPQGTRDEARALSRQLAPAAFSVEPVRSTIVVSQTPLLDLEARASER